MRRLEICAMLVLFASVAEADWRKKQQKRNKNNKSKNEGKIQEREVQEGDGSTYSMLGVSKIMCKNTVFFEFTLFKAKTIFLTSRHPGSIQL